MSPIDWNDGPSGAQRVLLASLRQVEACIRTGDFEGACGALSALHDQERDLEPREYVRALEYRQALLDAGEPWASRVRPWFPERTSKR